MSERPSGAIDASPSDVAPPRAQGIRDLTDALGLNSACM